MSTKKKPGKKIAITRKPPVANARRYKKDEHTAEKANEIDWNALGIKEKCKIF